MSDPSGSADSPVLAAWRLRADEPGAVLLLDTGSRSVVQANATAQQLAPGLRLPVPVQAWAAAAGLLDLEDRPLMSLLDSASEGALTVTARRSSSQSAAREPLAVFSLPLQDAGTLSGHALLVLLPVHDDGAVAAARAEAAEGDLRRRALLATALSFTLADARSPDLPLTWVNPAFCSTTGYSPQEVLGRNCRFLQGPDTDTGEVARLRKSLRAGRDVTSVLLNYRKDGSAFWNQVTITPVLDEAGEVTHFVGIQADVTERVVAERAREEALATEQLARLEAERARARAERVESQLRLLAATSEALSSTTGVRAAMTSLAAALVPQLADWAVISLLDDRDQLSQVVAAHRDGRMEELAAWERLQPRALGASSGTRTALRSGAPVLLAEIAPAQVADSLEEAAREEALRVLSDLGLRSAAVVPLLLHGQAVGTIAVMRGPAGQPFEQLDVETLQAVANRVALGLDNARLLDEAQRRSEILQRSLLPELPTLPGLQLAAAYLPSDSAAAVGGDWWDVFALTDEPGSPTALAVGDVMGHDVSAAAAMGQLRSVLRTCAWLGDSPRVVLERMDRLVQQFDMAQLATCLYARLEPADSPPGRRGTPRLHWSNAGHLPPVLRLPDGAARLLDEGVGVPIGVSGPERPLQSSVSVPPGSTLLLYTDGLVETRAGDIDDDLERLRHTIASLPRGASVEEILDAGLGQAPTDTDDITLLAVRVL